jgi:hypothetical protein
MSLVKVALNRMTKMFNVGKLSDGALKTIQSAEGAIRPSKQMAEGMIQGQRNKLGPALKEKGFFNNVVAAMGGGAATTKGGNIHIHDNIKDPILKAQFINHEGYERAELLNRGYMGTPGSGNIWHPKLGGNANPGLSQKIHDTAERFHLKRPLDWIYRKSTGMSEVERQTLQDFQKNHVLVGKHINLAVLGQESNDIRKLHKFHNARETFLPGARRGNGEAQLIEQITGKRYGQDPITKLDLEKLRNHKNEVTLKRGPYKELDLSGHVIKDSEAIQSVNRRRYFKEHPGVNFRKLNQSTGKTSLPDLKGKYSKQDIKQSKDIYEMKYNLDRKYRDIESDKKFKRSQELFANPSLATPEEAKRMHLNRAANYANQRKELMSQKQNYWQQKYKPTQVQSEINATNTTHLNQGSMRLKDRLLQST